MMRLLAISITVLLAGCAIHADNINVIYIDYEDITDIEQAQDISNK